MIEYKVNAAFTAEQFVDVLTRSGLAERRPVNDQRCMDGMIRNTNLHVTAWQGDYLIGIGRSLTDFHYACYVSDLAVDKQYQRQGIGKQLLLRTQEQLGPQCKLILIAAPAADAYYERIGFTRNPRCWTFERNQTMEN